MFQKLKAIGRFSTLLASIFLLGTTSLTAPALAAPDITGSNSVLVSVVPSSSQPALLNPSFNADQVTLGITPTGWSNSDDLSIDLDPKIPYQQILSEMALAGFKGTQNAPKFPKDLAELKRQLEMRGLRISEPWVGTEFTIGKTEETFKELDNQIAFMKEMGGNKIVVAELGEAVHQKPGADPLKDRPQFTEEQWTALCNGLDEMGKKANANGMDLVYHPHIGTGVQNFQEIKRLMKCTKAKNVKLLLDTGHLYYSSVDPLKVAQKYASRIKHVHLKNIRQKELDKSIATGRTFLDSIRAGIFTVPGDQEGAIDFPPILQELANVNYSGWLMVEAEQDPNNAEPLPYALTARTYLRNVIGF